MSAGDSSSRCEEPPRDLEAGEAGHLDVEEDEVGFVPFDGRDRLEAVASLRDHLRGPELFELKAELLARELLVVDDARPSCGDLLRRHQLGNLDARASCLCPGSLVSVSW